MKVCASQSQATVMGTVEMHIDIECCFREDRGRRGVLVAPNPGPFAALGGTGSVTECSGCLKRQNCYRSVTP